MILVSFSSVEDALFNDVTKYDTLRSQDTKNPPFRFFWGTPGIAMIWIWPEGDAISEITVPAKNEIGLSVPGQPPHELTMEDKIRWAVEN